MGDRALEEITKLVEKYGDSAYKEGHRDGIEKGIEQGYQRRQDELDTHKKVLERLVKE